MVYRRRTKKAKNLRRAIFVLIAGLFGFFIPLSGCEQFGALPTGESYLRIQQSKNYNLADDKFVNLEQDTVLSGPGFWDNPGKTGTIISSSTIIRHGLMVYCRRAKLHCPMIFMKVQTP